MSQFDEQTGSNNPFNNIDVGNYSAPTFVDVDGDGDLDAVVGDSTGTLDYYKNIGNATSPDYQAQTGSNNPFDGINVVSYSKPTFADVDGDGDLDVVVGEGGGSLNYYKNQGSATNPDYQAQTGSNNPFNNINVGFSSAPTFADVDGDGDLDAVVGEFDDNTPLNYYENVGNAASPDYQARTGSNNPFNGIVVGSGSAPTLADVDGDGDVDVVVGDNDGNLNYYENIGNATNPNYQAQTGSNNPFDGIDVGSSSTPTLADVDGDGVLDALVVGDNDGIVNYFECFGTGTLIATESGEIPVEQLKIGDLVKTATGQLEPIKWIGRKTCHPRKVRNPLRSFPILIKAGALGNNLPVRDLYLSPDHAVLLEGLLINAGALVNHASIMKTEPKSEFTYHHLELDKHALLMAEGTWAESYLPQREDRTAYDNWAEYEKLYPSGCRIILWPLDYPRVSSTWTVPNYIRKHLQETALKLGYVQEAA